MCTCAENMLRRRATARLSRLRLRSAVSCSGLVGAALWPVLVQQSAPGSQAERVRRAPGRLCASRDMEGRGGEWEYGRERRRARAKERHDQPGQGLQRTGKRSFVDQSASFFPGSTSSTARKLVEGAWWQ